MMTKTELTFPTTRTNADYCRYELQRRINEACEANQKLADDILKYGICDRRSWLQEPMRQDAIGQAAQKVINAIEAGESLKNIHASLVERFSKEVGYIIPTNSDTDANIYRVQAIKIVMDIVGFGMKEDDAQ